MTAASQMVEHRRQHQRPRRHGHHHRHRHRRHRHGGQDPRGSEYGYFHQQHRYSSSLPPERPPLPPPRRGGVRSGYQSSVVNETRSTGALDLVMSMVTGNERSRSSAYGNRLPRTMLPRPMVNVANGNKPPRSMANGTRPHHGPTMLDTKSHRSVPNVTKRKSRGGWRNGTMARIFIIHVVIAGGLTIFVACLLALVLSSRGKQADNVSDGEWMMLRRVTLQNGEIQSRLELSLFLFLYLGLSLSPSSSLFVSLSLCLSVSVSLCLPVSLSLYFTLSLPISLSLSRSCSLSVSLSISLSLSLSLSLSRSPPSFP